MRKFILSAVLLAATVANAADPPASSSQPAQRPKTQLERLEQLESLEKAMATINQFEASLDAMIRVRKLKCLKAFGNEAFCECLNKKLAVGLDFDGYIMAVTRTKEELKYNTLSKDDKALVDSAGNTRTLCAN
jgi:hypothetical protein